MKNNNLAFTIGATTLITLGALGLTLTGDKSVTIPVEESLAHQNNYTISNLYNDVVVQATDKVGYQNVIDTAKRKAEERELERLRLAEEQRKKEEELERKKAEEAKNDLGVFNVTWYTAKCKGCSGYTAKGINVKNTTIHQGYQVAATDWGVIPPYSIIEVEGYGQFIVIDRGGAIKGNKLDLLVATTNEANKNGRQYLNVKVIRWGDGK